MELVVWLLEKRRISSFIISNGDLKNDIIQTMEFLFGLQFINFFMTRLAIKNQHEVIFFSFYRPKNYTFFKKLLICQSAAKANRNVGKVQRLEYTIQNGWWNSTSAWLLAVKFLTSPEWWYSPILQRNLERGDKEPLS